MSRPILIISPDKRLNAALAEIIGQAGPLNRPVFLEHYPTFAQLGAFLSDHPNAHAGIVGFAEPDSARKAVDVLRVLQPDILAFGAHIEPAPRLAHIAIQAGAVDFLTPPWRPEKLWRRLEGAEFPSAEDATGEGALMAFLPAQGGDGASTVALHVAHRLAELVDFEAASTGVLLSDFDFHAGTTSFRLRLPAGRTIADALHAADTIESSWPRYLRTWNNVSVLPGPPFNAPLDLADAQNVPQLFQSAKRKFRFTLLDLPPALYSACKDVAMIAERLFVVCSTDRLSLHLAERRVHDLQQLGVAKEQIKLIVNRADSKNRFGPENLPEINGVDSLAALPNDYQRVNSAYLKGDIVDQVSPFRKAVDAMAETIYKSL